MAGAVEKYTPTIIDEPSAAPPRLHRVGKLQTFSDKRWIGCVETADKTIYLLGCKKVLPDGTALTYHTCSAIEQISQMVRPEGASIAQPGFFLALGGYLVHEKGQDYTVAAWRSGDDLTTVKQEVARVELPELGSVPPEGMLPACLTRSIHMLPDGRLLTSAYGCFKEDRLVPQERHSKIETKFKTRTFLLASRDRGLTWRYHATVAAPQEGDPVGEGFNEPAMERLADGRLLCILRTGHYTPLYACWSSDEGLTWTEPLYTGLERGCFPCLRRLADGRLALAYGERFPVGWSRITPGGDWPRYEPLMPGVGRVHLAISADDGASWQDQVIARNMGSCYTTFFEVKPGLLFFQDDGYFWYMRLTS